LRLTARQIYLLLLSSSPATRSASGSRDFSSAFWRQTLGACFATDLASASSYFSSPLSA
jgi:hypothetical protein